MPKRNDIKKILVVGSGPIVIGQACEFDYSGTQAVKALKEEGYQVVLVNSNPATIMTDQNLADRTYIEPITCEFVAKVIERERPDVLLPTIGGQTALNVTIELAEAGVLERFNVELIGAGIEAIKTAEDRAEFIKAVERCGLESARGSVVRNLEDGLLAAEKVGYPCIIRPSRTLGGSGGAIVNSPDDFEARLEWGFEVSPIHEVLVEESLIGWKEIELEVMRDRSDNGVIICGIENLDPMGMHTGDSITVAPVQTLTDKEYQFLRTAALDLMNEIGVDTGGSNVQFAIDPNTGRQIVIELNPRVSRSSALASKATGFPIAKIAAKLAVGYTLDELPNDITKQTPASFEPSIDYVVVKIPRFTFEKFEGADETLGTQMKSVGEAMAIGRTFAEALQKACRSLELDRVGIFGGPEQAETDLEVLKKKIPQLTPTRLYLAAQALRCGLDVDELYQLTSFDPWFTREIRAIIEAEEELQEVSWEELDVRRLGHAKRVGTSDLRIAQLCSVSEEEVVCKRHELGLKPSFKRVDTCAAEFESFTPYLYSTYDSHGDYVPSDKKKIVILGGGPNRIGQGLEFDYCCVHAAFALREAGYETIMINCNPETVSTDYDTSDVLYFEPLTLEDVREIVEIEKPVGVIVQYGGQTPLKLAQSLQNLGVPIIGTSPDSIDLTEDREKFRDLLDELGLKQAESGVARNEAEAIKVAERIGYPLMVRPSFVLGGRAMAVIPNEQELRKYIAQSVLVSFDRPVLIDRFLDDAIEIDVDAICDGEQVLVAGIIEHIERAGVHSGDSTFLLPSQSITDDTRREIEKAAGALAFGCGVHGLMNIQFAMNAEGLFVLEVNPRASRSVPFVSKVTGIPWAKVAARVMAGESLAEIDRGGDYGNVLAFKDYVQVVKRIPFIAVKESVFPFVKFRGVDALLGPEMRSTGEVMGIDDTVGGSFVRAQKAAGKALPMIGTAFVSVRDDDKDSALEFCRTLNSLGFQILATDGTARMLNDNGIEASRINKVREGSPHIVDRLLEGAVDLVINTPEGSGPLLDSRTIRTTSIDLDLPLFTTAAAATAAAKAIKQLREGLDFEVVSIQERIASIAER